MGGSVKKKIAVSAKDVLQTEIIVNQALIDLLIGKQVISEKELLNSIRKIKMEQETMRHDESKIVPLQRKG